MINDLHSSSKSWVHLIFPWNVYCILLYLYYHLDFSLDLYRCFSLILHFFTCAVNTQWTSNKSIWSLPILNFPKRCHNWPFTVIKGHFFLFLWRVAALRWGGKKRWHISHILDLVLRVRRDERWKQTSKHAENYLYKRQKAVEFKTLQSNISKISKQTKGLS